MGTKYTVDTNGNLTIAGNFIAGGTIAGNQIPNSSLANMPAHTLKGNNTASSATPSDLTVIQLQALLDIGDPLGRDSFTALDYDMEDPTDNCNFAGNITAGTAIFANYLSVGGGLGNISSLTANGVLFLDASKNIRANSNFTYNASGQLTLNDAGDGNLLILNNTNNSAVGHQMSFQKSGVNTLSIGHNNSASQSYVFSAATVLKFGTSSAEVARFSGSNLGLGVTSPDFLLEFPTTTGSKICLWKGAANQHQIFGFNINSAELNYQVNTTGSNHVFKAGTSSTTSNTLLTIPGNTGGVILPTTGGTASALTYYQESEAITFSVSGPWTARNWVVTFTRVGNIVTMTWPGLSAAVTSIGNQINSSAPIPVRYRPASIGWPVKTIDGASSIVINNGDLYVLTGGVLNITSNNNGNFVLANAGIVGGSSSWTL